MNNLFITFEGGEGSGKSTQVGLLKDYLDSQSLNTIITREPGGTPSAEILRDLLTRGKVDKWTAMSEALLMWAARYEHIVDVIDPALKAGKNVICDRFYDSIAKLSVTFSTKTDSVPMSMHFFGKLKMDRKKSVFLTKYASAPILEISRSGPVAIMSTV